MDSGGRQVLFENRHDAGRQLATKLIEYKNQSAVVLAIPNGGVPVALEVASALEADLDLVIARKIPLPLTPEGGFGAIADDGTIILNEEVAKRIGLSPQQIEYEASKVRMEVKQRNILYRRDWPPVSVSSKTVIVIDDGLASGITMRAAVESVRRRRPKEVIVAAPVTSAMALKQVGKVADRVVSCATDSLPNFYIADFYRYWYDLSDGEVVRYLNQWRMRHFAKTEPPQNR